ncbi:hypothetical protein PPACK8108_LOCUS7827 [Phakopsora pachyrhizi]|uniref:Uncharacterized protein n=1 Tax=Phakopsora pachyrhizi TaxID=170000 RepID=A0AAV0AX25_PHAPC|nr:hypothetical protein PPACK8108_LOCUS7827 [Phakopsora pachyrhizi]
MGHNFGVSTSRGSVTRLSLRQCSTSSFWLLSTDVPINQKPFGLFNSVIATVVVMFTFDSTTTVPVEFSRTAKVIQDQMAVPVNKDVRRLEGQGRLVGRQVGQQVSRQSGRQGRLAGRLAGWQAGRQAGWQAGQDGRQAGRAGRLAGRQGRLAGWLAGRQDR